jgi:DNA-binding MarR family transcriptional regulator
MIDSLEERGYVARKPHPTDKRRKLVVLTQKGWDCIQAVETIFATIEKRWPEVLGDEHMDILRADLRRLIRASNSDIVSSRLRPAGSVIALV